jgi:electron transfer flavoprotein beta subunit
MSAPVAVCVKAVPLDGADGAIGLDPVNEIALEWALRCREDGRGGDVIALTVGPPPAVDALRRALAMGGDDVLHVSDPALIDPSVGTTAEVLAAAVRHLGARLAVFGYESLDSSSGAVPAAVSARLGWPLLSFARSAVLDGDAVTVERDLEQGAEVVSAPLPVVVSFATGSIDPRYPKVKDVLATRARAVPVVDLATLGVDPPPTGGGGERVLGVRATPAPARAARVVEATNGPDEILRLLDQLAVLDA